MGHEGPNRLLRLPADGSGGVESWWFIGRGADRAVVAADGRRLAKPQGAFVMGWPIDRPRRAGDRLDESNATVFVRPPAPVVALAFAPDGGTLAVLTADRLLASDAAGEPLWESTAADDELIVLAATPDGRAFLVGGADGVVRTYDAATGAERGRLELPVGPVECLSVAAGGTVAVACGDGPTAIVWDLEG